MEEIWPLSDSDDEDGLLDNSTSPASSNPVWILLFFLLYWQVVYKVSNNALTSLLRFLKYFVCMVGRAFGSPHLEEFSRQVPISLKDAYSRCGIASREFIEYVVCPCCHSVYEYEDCIQSVGGETISKCCRHVSYPNHPQPSRRQQCGAYFTEKRLGQVEDISLFRSKCSPICLYRSPFNHSLIDQTSFLHVNNGGRE